MHPCLSDAVVQLRRVLNDPSNVPKVRDLVNVSIELIERYGNQGSVTEAPKMPNPENVQGPEPEAKAPAKKKAKK